MKPQQPPDDALLWRVETNHTEIVCFVVAAPDGGVGSVWSAARSSWSRSHTPHWGEPSNTPRSFALHWARLDCRTRGMIDAVANEAATSHWARRPRCRVFQNPTRLRPRSRSGGFGVERAQPEHVPGRR